MYFQTACSKPLLGDDGPGDDAQLPSGRSKSDVLSRLAPPSAWETPSERMRETPHDFDYVIVFPMPSAPNIDDEEREFQKQHAVDKSGYKKLLLDRIVDESTKTRLQTELDKCESLAHLRANTIQMFCSFFESLFASHGAGQAKASKLFAFTCAKRKHLFLCVSLGDVVAESLAVHGEYGVQLEAKSLHKLGIEHPEPKASVPAYVNFEFFQKREGLVRKYERPGSVESAVLRRVDRIRLMYDKITDYLDFDGFEQLGLVAEAYPVHDSAIVETLRSKWVNRSLLSVQWSRSQAGLPTLEGNGLGNQGDHGREGQQGKPMDIIRDYFGEKIAFYFLFLEKLATAEITLAIIAIPTSIFRHVLSGTQYGDVPQLLYSLCLVLWFMGFAKHWRRVQFAYANRWGMDTILQDEIKQPINPRFCGEKQPSPLNKLLKVLRPDKQKQFRGSIKSMLAQVMFMLVVVVGVSTIEYFAAEFDAQGNSWAYQIAALALIGQIKVLDFLWTSYFVVALTDWEQHVSLADYDTSKARKTFRWKFINTFYSFFYTAFFEGILDPDKCKSAGGCPRLLHNNLTIVYLTYIALSIVDVVKPVVSLKYRIWKDGEVEREAKQKKPEKRSFLEHQAKMDSYRGDDHTADYLEIVLPMYFFVMFSMVAPLFSVGLAVLCIVTQLRADAWKLLLGCRRVFPDKAAGIGGWNVAVGVLEFLCIIVNILLVITQLDLVALLGFWPHLQELLLENPVAVKTLIFFVALNVLMTVRAVINILIPDKPKALSLERARQNLQRLKLLEKQITAKTSEWVKIRVTQDLTCPVADKAEPLQRGHARFEEPLPLLMHRQ